MLSLGSSGAKAEWTFAKENMYVHPWGRELAGRPPGASVGYILGSWWQKKYKDLQFFVSPCIFGSPNGTRTRVFGVRGRYPRPLDDGTAKLGYMLLVISY